MTPQILDALNNANSPTSLNPFATLNDIGVKSLDSVIVNSNGTLTINFTDGNNILDSITTVKSVMDIKYNVLNYSGLSTIIDQSLYDFAYVRQSQGTAWLPGVIGGTYYGAGLYMWNGTSWIEDKTNIYQELDNIIDTKEDSSNKSTLLTDSSSSIKFPVWSAIVSYFDINRIKTILGITTLSGDNTGDETLSSLQTKRPLKTINGNTLEGNGNIVTPNSTNLTTTQSPTNIIINSDTGTDATIPLGNGVNAGLSLNDYTTVEKNKLAGIATGAEVNVNADWNASSGDAQILNKPIIPTTTSQLTNNSGFITTETDPIVRAINGIVKSNGTTISAAIAGTDYALPNSNTTGSAATLTTGRTIAMTGDVAYTSPTFNGSANITAAGTIQNNVVSNVKLAQMPANTFKANNTGSTANATDITVSQAKTLLAITNTDVSGLGTLATQSGTFTAIPQSNITNLTTDLANKQSTLISGTNIKTVNGNSLLGSGDVVISGGSSNLDGLTDVVITNATSGQVLKYNGTNWINDVDNTSAGGSGLTHNEVMSRISAMI